MKCRRTILLAGLFLLGLLRLGAAAIDPEELSVWARFAREDDLEQAIDFAIGWNHKTVRVLVESLTSGKVADALIEARTHGADVRVMIDPRTLRWPGSMVPYLLKHGVPVYGDDQHESFRYDVLILDDEKIIFGGGFAATFGRREAHLQIRNQRLAETFLRQWEAHQPHARLLGPQP